MSEPKEPMGLREKILAAKSEKEVDDLLLIGTHYQYAPPSAKRRWYRAAEITRARLAVEANSAKVVREKIANAKDKR